MLPTGYAFNLDGTSLFMAMGLMFISHACGVPLSLDAQFGILVLLPGVDPNSHKSFEIG